MTKEEIELQLKSPYANVRRDARLCLTAWNAAMDLAAEKVEMKINTGRPPAIDKDSITSLKIKP